MDGALLIPTFQRYFSRAVEHFQVNRSLQRLLLYIFRRGGINYMWHGDIFGSTRSDR
ncbi:DUF2837 family protein [Paraburkholderia caffeinilytica]